MTYSLLSLIATWLIVDTNGSGQHVVQKPQNPRINAFWYASSLVATQHILQVVTLHPYLPESI